MASPDFITHLYFIASSMCNTPDLIPQKRFLKVRFQSNDSE